MLHASIVRNERLSPGARLLWAVIRSKLWKDGRCWAKDTTLAEQLAVSDRQIRRYCAELRAEKYLGEKRRLGQSPIRWLLWHEGFEVGNGQEQNPGPDDAENEPFFAVRKGPVSRSDTAIPLDKYVQPDGPERPTYPNKRSFLTDCLTASSNDPPNVGRNTPISEAKNPGDAKQGRAGENPNLGTWTADQVTAALTERGVNALGIRKVLRDLPRDYDALRAIEWTDHLIQARPGKITNPSGFYLSILQSRALVAETFMSASDEAARVEEVKSAELLRAAEVLVEEKLLDDELHALKEREPKSYWELSRQAADYWPPESRPDMFQFTLRELYKKQAHA